MSTMARHHQIHILTTFEAPPGTEVEPVLGMRFDSGELMQNTNEIIAYGTAVKLRPKGP